MSRSLKVTLPEIASGGEHQVFDLPPGAVATFDRGKRVLDASVWPPGFYEVGYAWRGRASGGTAPSVVTRLSIGNAPDGNFRNPAPAPASAPKRSHSKAKPKG